MSVFIVLISLMLSFEASADVRFITETENTADYEKFQKLNPAKYPETPNYNIDAKTRCGSEGYTYSKCSNGFFLADPCPYDYSFYANCCPDNYRYTAEECRAQGKTLGTYSCGGFYKCE